MIPILFFLTIYGRMRGRMYMGRKEYNEKQTGNNSGLFCLSKRNAQPYSASSPSPSGTVPCGAGEGEGSGDCDTAAAPGGSRS